MDFIKCFDCPTSMQPWVIWVLSAVVVLFVWRSIRKPRQPDWWHGRRNGERR
jgi:hypothetical protein